MNKKYSVENTFQYTLTCLKQKALAAFRSNLPMWVAHQLPKHEHCVADWTISMENDESGANLIMALDIKVPEEELSKSNCDKVSIVHTDKGKEFVIKNAKFFYCYSCVKLPHHVGATRTSFIYSEKLPVQYKEE